MVKHLLSSNLISDNSLYNVGDIFYTSRLDTELNGAVNCDGGLYSSENFTGNQNVFALLSAGKIPYVSMTDFDACVTEHGSCRCFGWDGADATVFRVPLIEDVYLMAGTAASAGEFISESLPNITGDVGYASNYGFLTNNVTRISGAFKKGQETTASPDGSSKSGYSLAFDASGSSSTYQDGAKVRPDSVRYRAMVQLASSVKEDATQLKEYKFNNPCFFGQSIYSDVEPNNASWLKSAGQWNSGTVYTGMYNWLLEQRNAELKTMYGWHSTTGTQTQILFLTLTNTLSVDTEFYGYIPNVKAGTITAISGNNVTTKNDIDNTTGTSSIDISDPVPIESQYIYDTSKMNIITKSELDNWRGSINTSDYDFVINTADQTFRLPLLNGEEDLQSDRYDDLTLGASGTLYTAPANGFYRFSINLPASSYFAIFDGNTGDVKELITNEVAAIAQNYVVTVHVRKGQTIRIQYVTVSINHSSRFYYATGNGNLYYYIGDTVQDAQLVNVARIEETLVDKANTSLSNLDATGQAKFDAKANVSNFQVVSELPAEPDANTFYFIPET